MSALQSNAMLVELNISLFRGTKQDDRGTLAARTALNTTSSKGRFTKQVLADKISPITTLANKIYNWHRTMTLPYKDGGARLLPMKNYNAYESGMRNYCDEFKAQVEDFESHYEANRDAEISDPRNGGMFLPSDYPPKSQVKKLFNIKTDWDSVPDKSHFIVALEEEQRAKIMESIDERILEAQKAARNDLYERLAEKLLHIADKMRTYKEGKSRLHPSTIENLRDLCDIIPNLNITDDPEIEKLRLLALDHVGSMNVDDLKDSAELRQHTAQSADSILEAMGIIKPSAPQVNNQLAYAAY
jgi:hypothetical protein